MKRTLLFPALAALLLLIGQPLAFAAPAAPDSGAAPDADPVGETAGFLLLGENGGSRLLLDTATTELVVEAAQGARFSAFPSGADDDPIASGAVKNDMHSLLSVSYIDEQDSEFTVNSAVGSVRRQAYAVKKLKNADGAVIEFTFPREKENFKVPLRVTLEEGALRCEVLFDQIEEYGTARVTGVTLLPYLLAGNAQEAGYVLVPDGCGMAIAFDARVPGSFSGRVYGDDAALTKRTQTGIQQTVALPVLGMVGDGRAALGIIEQADAFATIHAQAPQTDSAYASVACSFLYRQMDVSILADKEWNERDVTVVSERVTPVNPVVTYHFREGNAAQPAGLAAVYRQYLLDGGAIAPTARDGAPLCQFELFGAVKKAGSVLGIPVERTVSATTADDVAAMMAAFRDKGITASTWTLHGFTTGGLYGSVPGEAGIDGAVGGARAYQAMLAAAKDTGARVYLGADLQNLYRSSLRFSSLTAAVKQLGNDNATQYAFKRNLSSRDKSVSWQLLRPGRLAEAATVFLNGYASVKGAGVALLAAGDTLYSDFNKSAYTDRGAAMQAMGGMVDALRAGAGSLLLTGGNAYALRGADGVVNAPSESSGYLYESFELPFYQLVFHGVLPLAAAPVNAMDGEGWERRLKNLETGMLPHYRLTHDSPAVYQDTRLNFLYNTTYTNWLDDCAAHYARYGAVQGKLQGEVAVDYRLVGAVRRVTYADGTVVYANYGDSDATVDGVRVPAHDCAVQAGV